MAQIGDGGGSDYPTSIDTAEQQIDGAAGTIADANWANDVTAAITAIQNALGTDPGGDFADLVTRIATVVKAAGGVPSGATANRPASPGTGYPYYNTTLGQVEIYNGSTWISVAGVTDHGSLTGLGDDDHAIYAKADGSRTFTGAIKQERATPYVMLAGTETNADKYGIKEDGGVLYISRNTGTVASPTWTDLISITTGGVLTALTDNIVCRDTANSENVSMSNHKARHRLSGNDQLYEGIQLVGDWYDPGYEHNGLANPLVIARYKSYFTIENTLTLNARGYGQRSAAGSGDAYMLATINGSAITANASAIFSSTIGWYTGSGTASGIGGEVEITISLSSGASPRTIQLSGCSLWLT